MPLGALDRTRCSLRRWTELRSAIFGKTSFKSPHLSSRRAVPVWLPPHGSMPCDVLHPPYTYHIPPSTVVPSCFHRGRACTAAKRHEHDRCAVRAHVRARVAGRGVLHGKV